MRVWIKNTDGKPDAMLTLTVVAFFVVMLKVIAGGSDWNIGEWSIHIDPIGAELAAVLLGTNTVGYVARRHTDKKFDAGADAGNDGSAGQPE